MLSKVPMRWTILGCQVLICTDKFWQKHCLRSKIDLHFNVPSGTEVWIVGISMLISFLLPQKKKMIMAMLMVMSIKQSKPFLQLWKWNQHNTKSLFQESQFDKLISRSICTQESITITCTALISSRTVRLALHWKLIPY